MGVFVLAENIGTVLKVFVGILIVVLIIGCLYQLSLEVGSDSKASEKNPTPTMLFKEDNRENPTVYMSKTKQAGTQTQTYFEPQRKMDVELIK